MLIGEPSEPYKQSHLGDCAPAFIGRVRQTLTELGRNEHTHTRTQIGNANANVNVFHYFSGI